jgi:AcrR family transcriptional regulator
MVYRRTEKVVRRLAARHDAIVAAARGLAADAGMSAVQIAPVAERAGIAAGTVYRYFPSKTDLVGALVDSACEQDVAAIRGAAAAAPGPLSALAAAVTTFAARALRQRQLAWALIAEAVDPDIERARLPYRRALAAEFEARLKAAIASRNLPDQDTCVAAPALVGALLEGLAGPLAAEAPSEAKTREAIQTLTLFALRAVGVVDAHARGLVVQTALPADDAA